MINFGQMWDLRGFLPLVGPLVNYIWKTYSLNEVLFFFATSKLQHYHIRSITTTTTEKGFWDRPFQHDSRAGPLEAIVAFFTRNTIFLLRLGDWRTMTGLTAVTHGIRFI